MDRSQLKTITRHAMEKVKAIKALTTDEEAKAYLEMIFLHGAETRTPNGLALRFVDEVIGIAPVNTKGFAIVTFYPLLLKSSRRAHRQEMGIEMRPGIGNAYRRYRRGSAPRWSRNRKRRKSQWSDPSDPSD